MADKKTVIDIPENLDENIQVWVGNQLVYDEPFGDQIKLRNLLHDGLQVRLDKCNAKKVK